MNFSMSALTHVAIPPLYTQVVGESGTLLVLPYFITNLGYTTLANAHLYMRLHAAMYIGLTRKNMHGFKKLITYLT
jgi:hypothetical protein